MAKLLTALPTEELQKTQLQSLGREDPLLEEMATPSSILAWEIPQRSLVGLPGVARVGHD